MFVIDRTERGRERERKRDRQIERAWKRNDPKKKSETQLKRKSEIYTDLDGGIKKFISKYLDGRERERERERERGGGRERKRDRQI